MQRLLCTWVLLAGLTTTVEVTAQPAATCKEWRACRVDALAAEAAGDMERFHDFAWRTVQLGPKDDPAQLYLLARAQVASGRPSDALVMLRRLAEMGVATDADTLDVFARVRAREGWAEVEALMAGARTRIGAEADGADVATAAGVGPATPPPAPGAGADTPSADASAGAPLDAEPSVSAATAAGAAPVVAIGTALPGVDAVRLDDIDVATGGFAYDAVSRRFLLGHTPDRKIVVVDAESRRAADLVRGDSAGFRDMQAMHIDTRRGDLWVLSNDGTPTGAALHKLQLVAGRPLARLTPPASAGAARFTDLTVTPGGSVLVLDGEGRRVFRAAPRGTALDLVASLDLASPVAITAADSEHVVYVAHAEGVSRVDLTERRAQAVRSSEAVPLDGIRRVWWHQGSLVVLRTCPLGGRLAQRLELDRRGVAVVAMRPLDISLPDGSADVAATMAGDELYVMAADRTTATNGGADDRQVVVRRVTLRR